MVNSSELAVKMGMTHMPYSAGMKLEAMAFLRMGVTRGPATGLLTLIFILDARLATYGMAYVEAPAGAVVPAVKGGYAI